MNMIFILFLLMYAVSASSTNLDDSVLTGLLERMESFNSVSLQGEDCEAPGNDISNQIIRCVKNKNMNFVQKQISSLEEEINHLNEKIDRINTTGPTQGLNYKKWVLDELESEKQEKRESLDFYKKLQIKLSCLDTSKHKEMPIFENYSQLRNYYINKMSLTTKMEHLAPFLDKSLSTFSKNYQYHSKTIQPSRSQKAEKLMDSLGFSLKSPKTTTLSSEELTNFKSENLFLHQTQEINSVLDFLAENDIGDLAKKFPLHMDTQKNPATIKLFKPDKDPRLLVNHPKLVDIISKYPQLFLKALQRYPKLANSYSKQLNTAIGLTQFAEDEDKTGLLSHPDLAAALTIELKSVTPGYKISQQELENYVTNIQSSIHQNKSNYDLYEESFIKLFQKDCIQEVTGSSPNIEINYDFENHLYTRSPNDLLTRIRKLSQKHNLKLPREISKKIKQQEIIGSNPNLQPELNYNKRKEELIKKRSWVMNRHENIENAYRNLEENASMNGTSFSKSAPIHTESHKTYLVKESKLFNTPSSSDLRYLYDSQTLSQQKENSCVAHSINNLFDASYIKNGRVKNPESNSVSGIYGILKAQELGVPVSSSNFKRETFKAAQKVIPELRKKSIKSSEINSILSRYLDTGLQIGPAKSYGSYQISGFTKRIAAFSKIDVPKKNKPKTTIYLPTKLKKTQNGSKLRSLTSHEFGTATPPRLEVIKNPVLNGTPVMVATKYSDRVVHEGWANFNNQGVPHAMVIIGSEVSRDPHDGKVKEAFLVRDSMCRTKKCPTYRTSAKKLILNLVHGIYSATIE